MKQRSADRVLGIRYRLLKGLSTGGLVQTDQNEYFRTGDLLRVVVMPNHDGYLYVITRDPDGFWCPLFPNPKTNSRSEVVAGETYTIPMGVGRFFTFVGKGGDERLFLMLSKTPFSSFDQILQKMKDAYSSPPTPARPADAPRPPLGIDDALVNGLRNAVQYRTIVEVEVEEKPAGSQAPGEKFHYVLNKVDSTSVITHLVLKHEPTRFPEAIAIPGKSSNAGQCVQMAR